MSKYKIDLIGYMWYVRQNNIVFSGPYKNASEAKSEVNRLNK